MKKYLRAARQLMKLHSRPKTKYPILAWHGVPLRIMSDFKALYWDEMKRLFPDLPNDVLEDITVLALEKLAQEARDNA